VLKNTDRIDSNLKSILLSSNCKSFLSKLFWALLIKIYRIKPKTAFQKIDKNLIKAYESLMDEVAWEYVNFQEVFVEKSKNSFPDQGKFFLVICGLVSQIIFMMFYKGFPEFTGDSCFNSKTDVFASLRESTPASGTTGTSHVDIIREEEIPVTEESVQPPTKTKGRFGKNFLICITFEVFTLINGLRPNLQLLSMFPMDKLTNTNFNSIDDFDLLPHGAKLILKTHFPNGDYRNNTGSGTIILGLMSGLLERYCDKHGSAGAGQAVGVLVQRRMKRTLI